jgi:hypothetical protein
MKEILSNSDRLFNQSERKCLGIDLRQDAQLELFNHLSLYYNDRPYCNDISIPTGDKNPVRYFEANSLYGIGDALILYSFLRYLRPKKVIEIGSGFSSAVMLDVNDLFLEKTVHFTFIEPNPERLFNLINSEDRNKYSIVEKNVQDVPLNFFKNLSKGDILFVDSSHVGKIGSDVLDIFFKILPVLNPGVIIHFHDIPWPFEYSMPWFQKGTVWNEAYFLRTFLQFNSSFEILYYNAFMIEFYSSTIKDKMPILLDSPGLSIWLRKTDNEHGN